MVLAHTYDVPSDADGQTFIPGTEAMYTNRYRYYVSFGKGNRLILLLLGRSENLRDSELKPIAELRLSRFNQEQLDLAGDIRLFMISILKSINLAL